MQAIVLEILILKHELKDLFSEMYDEDSGINVFNYVILFKTLKSEIFVNNRYNIIIKGSQKICQKERHIRFKIYKL